MKTSKEITSQIAQDYENCGYAPHFIRECYETIEEDCKECDECHKKTMEYIGLKKKDSFIAIALCKNCGFEYEF